MTWKAGPEDRVLVPISLFRSLRHVALVEGGEGGTPSFSWDNDLSTRPQSGAISLVEGGGASGV